VRDAAALAGALERGAPPHEPEPAGGASLPPFLEAAVEDGAFTDALVARTRAALRSLARRRQMTASEPLR
jgi:hypothetical protein